MAAKKKMATRDILDFDQIVGFWEKVRVYLEENARLLIALGLIICLAAGGLVFWTVSSRTAAQEAQAMLNSAMKALSAADETEDERSTATLAAQEDLSRIVERYPRTDAGRAALFYLAVCKSRMQDYSGALDKYRIFLRQSGWTVDTLRPFALENKGFAHEALGNDADALAWLEKAAQAGRNTALIAMARIHENAGDMHLACESYQRYLDDHTDSVYRDLAEVKIGDICP